MGAEDDIPEEGELTSRAPTQEDLVALCRALNAEGARYLVIGGFAIIQAGYPRSTSDLDFLMDASLENEARVFKALEILPDKAVLELTPGEVSQYTVIRIGMRSPWTSWPPPRALNTRKLQRKSSTANSMASSFPLLHLSSSGA
ncbi:MAG: hypothetical protein JWO08_693 [Verrucomicrobiaceae bacterium]|nr:hypothetical protein [Verrucomicrobiaceae bacterium]